MSLFNQLPQDYRILFLDMDSFFASCEEQMCPQLRGKPIGVVPEIVPTTCVLSASYVAKHRGVKTGTLVGEAQRLCPDITFVAARPGIYKQIHYQIVDILNKISPWVYAKSIDEFAMVLGASERNLYSANSTGHTIKTQFFEKLGPYITTSIGFGPNQFLAKVASEMEKPNGLTHITIHNYQARLSSLELTDLPGIARATERRLHAEDIYTVEQLLNLSAQTLRRLFGFMGEVWWYRLHGIEVDDVEHNRSSIGHSHILPPSWRTPEKARQVLQRLVHKTGQRLRKEGFFARHTALAVKYLGAPSFHAYARTQYYRDTHTMVELAEALFAHRPPTFKPILGLVFTLSDLKYYPALPQNLFPEINKPLQLTYALDAINDTYGRDTIFQSSMLQAKHTAPDRIPFGEVRY